MEAPGRALRLQAASLPELMVSCRSSCWKGGRCEVFCLGQMTMRSVPSHDLCPAQLWGSLPWPRAAVQPSLPLPWRAAVSCPQALLGNPRDPKSQADFITMPTQGLPRGKDTESRMALTPCPSALLGAWPHHHPAAGAPVSVQDPADSSAGGPHPD